MAGLFHALLYVLAGIGGLVIVSLIVLSVIAYVAPQEPKGQQWGPR